MTKCRWNVDQIFILYLTPGFNRLGKDECKTRRESFKFWDLVCLILEILWYLAEDLLTFNGTLYQQPSWEPFLYKMPSYQYIPLKSDGHLIFINGNAHAWNNSLNIEREPWRPSQYKDNLSWCGYFHYEHKTVMRPSYFYNGNLFTKDDIIILRRPPGGHSWGCYNGLDDLMQDGNISNSEHPNSRMVLSETMAECRVNS